MTPPLSLPLLQPTQLLACLPHRPPMILVDALFAVSEHTAETGLHITHDTPFVENHALTEAGLIEHMAQSAAAGAGWRALLGNQLIPLGFIASINRLTIAQFPSIGITLRTRVQLAHQVGPIHVLIAETRIADSDTVVCSCEFKVALQPAVPTQT